MPQKLTSSRKKNLFPFLVADAGFPRGHQPIIRPTFPENCLKTKKIGPSTGLDPEFPRWGPPTTEIGAKTYYLARVWGKLYENERNLTERGTGHP